MTSIIDDAVATYKVDNTSRIGRMMWIGFYTFLLNIITLTLFRFWGRTHFRQQLWSDTTIGDHALEYTGRGKELFFGFLMAIFTVMLPTFIAIIGAQFMFGEVGAAIVILLVYIGMFWLIGVAIFLARRYVISRTRYRGIRLEQRGSAVSYGWKAFGYGILSGITLGWYAPAARIKLSRYMWDNAYFGSEDIKFEDTEEALAEPVYKSFALMWVGGAILYIGLFAIAGMSNILENMAYGDMGAVGLFYLLALGVGFLFAFVAAWHTTVMIRRIVKSLSIAGARATCDLQSLKLLKVWILYFFIVIFTLGIGLFAGEMMLWRAVAKNVRFEGAVDFDAIEQAASTGPSQGEGIADGLDIASGF